MDNKFSQKHGRMSPGQMLADLLTKWAGSWAFISIFIVIILVWICINTILLVNKAWDPYPFILLNLCLSCLAAIQAPIILMSQNRMNEIDRQKAQNDYLVNRKAEREIKQAQLDILEIKEVILKQSTKNKTDKLREEIKKIQEELEQTQNLLKK